jgi:outer membrane protein assembly factor BamB
VDEPFNVEDRPEPVPSGQSGDVLVRFEPVAPGDISGALTLSTSSLALPSVTVQLHGIAYSPALEVGPDRLDFGDVNIGEQKALIFDVTNRGPVGLNLSVDPIEKGSDFAISPQGGLGTLGAGQKITVTVSFAPSVPGIRSSSALLSCPVCKTRQVAMTGNGIGAAIVVGPDAGPADSGTPAADAGTPGVDAGPADAGTPGVDAGPADSGTPGVDAGPADSGTPGVDAGPADSGTPDADAGPPPVETCALQANPGAIDFGLVAPGGTARQQITISSTGVSACFVQVPYLAPGSDPSFSAAPLQAWTLRPGESAVVTAFFAPGPKTALAVSGTLVFISNDHDRAKLEVALSGAVDQPPPPPPPPAPGVLVVAPKSLTFTAQAPAAPAPQTLTLHNDGGSSLSWTAASDDSRMSPSIASGTLAPGADALVTVSVQGQAAAGSRSQLITVDAGAAGNARVPVQINFTQAPPPPPAPAVLDVQPLALSFSAQLPKAPPAQSITVSNLGGAGLTWQGTVDDSGVSFAPASGTLAGGSASLVRVSVSAAPFAGKRSATLTIDAGAAGRKLVAIAIEFTSPPPPPPPPQYGGSAWPKWHHDNASSGLSHIDTSSNGGAVFWKAQIGPPVPCINDGRTNNKIRCGTYVNSPVLAEDGSVIQLGGDGRVNEFDRATGGPLWRAQTAPPWIAANEGTPTVVKDGSIYLMTAGESFSKPQYYKISKGGQILWHNEPGGTCGGIPCDGFDSSPALGDDGTLYLALDDESAIVAHDQRGLEVGRVQLDPKSDIETQSGALAPDNVGYWSANGHLWALTRDRQLWSFTDPVAAKTQDWRPGPAHNIKSSPAVTADGKVVFTYVYETVKNGVTMQTTKIYAFAAGAKKKQLWAATLGPTVPKKGLPPGPGLPAEYADSLHYRSGITSPAVGPDGTVYVGHCDGLFALDSKTGKFRWGVGLSEVVSSPAIGADGTVYVGSMNGLLSAITPAGSVKWQVATGGQLNSSPAIGADGTIYAMSDDGYLYAVK